MLLKHKIKEILTPFKHTTCKIMTILMHIHVQPCRPKENIGDHLSPPPHPPPHLYFIFFSKERIVFWVIALLAWLLIWFFLLEWIIKQHVILPFFLISSMGMHKTPAKDRYTWTKIHVPVYTLYMNQKNVHVSTQKKVQFKTVSKITSCSIPLR